MKTALLASYTKDADLIRLANVLKNNDWQILGSAGTAKYLNENNISCDDVATIVGPPILGHRVVTLSRELHAGLLALPSDQAELDKLGVPRIDLVYVTLDPLEEAVANRANPHEVIEKTDIGGPTLLRSAAKGRRLVLSNSAQIDDVQAFIEAGEPETERENLINRLVAAEERRVAMYVDVSAAYWESQIQ